MPYGMPFGATYNDGTVVLYRVNDYAPTLLCFDPADADAELVRYNPPEIDVEVKRSAEGARLGVKVACYPLWTAVANARRLEVVADEYGLMQIRLPAGTEYLASLRYEPKLAEHLGAAVSLGSFLFVAVGSATALVRKALARRHRKL